VKVLVSGMMMIIIIIIKIIHFCDIQRHLSNDQAYESFRTIKIYKALQAFVEFSRSKTADSLVVCAIDAVSWLVIVCY
jgi:hypothetical protein